MRELPSILMHPTEQPVPKGAVASDSAAGEMSLVDALGVLWRGKWRIAVCFVAALVAGAVYLSRQPLVFESQTQLYVEASTVRPLGENPLIVATSANFLSSQARLIRSTPILRVAVDLARDEEPDLLGPGAQGINYLRAVSFVHVHGGEDVITIGCRTHDPDVSASFASAIAAAFVRFHDEKQRATAESLADLLAAERDGRERELAEVEHRIVALRSRDAMLAGAGGSATVSAQFSEMLSTHQQAQLATIEARSAFEAIEASGGIPAGGLYTASQANLELAETQLVAARDRYGNANRVVQELEVAIARLRDTVADEREAAAHALMAQAKAEYEIAQRREQAIAERLEEQRERVLSASRAAAEFAHLSERADWLRESIDSANDRLKELEAAEDIAPLRIMVLEPAVPADAPVEPNPIKIIGMAGVIGLMFGTAAVFLQTLLDPRLRSTDELRQVVDTPVIGVLPHCADGTDLGIVGRASHVAPMSDFAESSRNVRTAVMLADNGRTNRTILVTSPNEGEGKSIAASNLAITLAQSGERTLLIDADLRRPSQDRIFDVTPGTGVVGVMRGDDTLESAIQSTGLPNLDVLPCGRLPSNPSELINSPQFAGILEILGETYDRIVLDSPPLLRLSDSRILADRCTSTLLVLRATRSTRQDAWRAYDIVRASGGRLIGVVFNGMRGAGIYGRGYFADTPGSTLEPIDASAVSAAGKRRLESTVAGEVSADRRS